MNQGRYRFVKPVVSLLLMSLVVLLLIGLPQLVNGQTTAEGNCSSSPDQLIRSTALLSPLASGAMSSFSGATGAPAVEVRADTWGLPLAEDELSQQYEQPSVLLQAGDSLSFDVTIPEDGEYVLQFDVAVPAESDPAEGQLAIDGEFPLSDLGQFTFPVFYGNSTDTFPRDRYGNEALIAQEREARWTRYALRDGQFSQPYPLRVSLAAGEHHFEFTLTDGELNLGTISLTEFVPYPTYDDYLAAQTASDTSGFLQSLE
ncbi:MAG: hypothetical protein U0452_12145, partial [Anaerolineae bacterium]